MIRHQITSRAFYTVLYVLIMQSIVVLHRFVVKYGSKLLNCEMVAIGLQHVQHSPPTVQRMG